VDPTAISCLVMWRFKPISMRVTFSVITLQKLRPLNSTSTFLHCSISSISHSLRLTSFTLSNVSITRTRAQRTSLISHRQVKHTTHHLVEHNSKPKCMRLSNPTIPSLQLYALPKPAVSSLIELNTAIPPQRQIQHLSTTHSTTLNHTDNLNIPQHAAEP